MGYYQISTDASGSLETITTNENFEGETYATVSNKQYLKLQGCNIIQ